MGGPVSRSATRRHAAGRLDGRAGFAGKEADPGSRGLSQRGAQAGSADGKRSEVRRGRGSGGGGSLRTAVGHPLTLGGASGGTAAAGQPGGSRRQARRRSRGGVSVVRTVVCALQPRAGAAVAASGRDADCYDPSLPVAALSVSEARGGHRAGAVGRAPRTLTLMFGAFAVAVIEAARSFVQAMEILKEVWHTIQEIVRRAVERGLLRRSTEAVTQVRMDGCAEG
jgi:hypothetical protein